MGNVSPSNPKPSSQGVYKIKYPLKCEFGALLELLLTKFGELI